MQPRILLVDDENAIRNSLYELLESNGYEVLAASNGVDGLTIFRQSIRPIELLVTDCSMPRMSGLELARECSLLCNDLRVLYVSGTRPDEDLEADLRAGRREFLAIQGEGAAAEQRLRLRPRFWSSLERHPVSITGAIQRDQP